MTRIAPGTPCFIVQLPDGTVEAQYLGRVVTVVRQRGQCMEHGTDMYHVADRGLGLCMVCRAMLCPILPPDAPDSEPRVVDVERRDEIPA